MHRLELDNRIEISDNYADEIQRYETDRNNRVSLGYELTDQDYDDLTAMYKQQAQNVYDAYAEASRLLEPVTIGANETIGGQIIGSDEYKQRQKEMQGLYDQYLSWMFKADSNEHEKEMLPITQLENELAELQLVGNEIQAEFDAIGQRGDSVSEEDYTRQTENLEKQREVIKNIRTEYMNLYKNHQGDSFGLEMLKGVEQADARLRDIDSKEYNIDFTVDHKELTDLQDEYTLLDMKYKQLQSDLSDPI